uniref:Adaptor related protein complex 1 associated regulatory protein n=1 Tax=Electrophorus electricus TaxID=8005 RepID=A0A4W4G792_ELEEL
MGNCWTQCCGIFRREANRIQRGGGSKYFRSSTTGEAGYAHLSLCWLRPISEEEIGHLKEQCYGAIVDKQMLIDEKLNAELVEQEEKLRLEEEAICAAQRQAARLAKERVLKEVRLRCSLRERACVCVCFYSRPSGGEFEVYLQTVKAQSEAFRTSRLSSDTNVGTPNTECSWDFTSKTRSTNDDATSLDLEWEDEEGMNRLGPVWERSKTEEDILRAALRPGGARLGSGPTSTSEDSNALEWENDFVSAHVEEASDRGDEEFEGFVNPALDTPSETAEIESNPDHQDR